MIGGLAEGTVQKAQQRNPSEILLCSFTVLTKCLQCSRAQDEHQNPGFINILRQKIKKISDFLVIIPGTCSNNRRQRLARQRRAGTFTDSYLQLETGHACHVLPCLESRNARKGDLGIAFLALVIFILPSYHVGEHSCQKPLKEDAPKAERGGAWSLCDGAIWTDQLIHHSPCVSASFCHKLCRSPRTSGLMVCFSRDSHKQSRSSIFFLVSTCL